MSVHTVDYDEIRAAIGAGPDEPIFIIRGKDDLAMAIVTRYRNMASAIEYEQPNDEWFHQMDQVISEFGRFRIEHPELMKVPD